MRVRGSVIDWTAGNSYGFLRPASGGRNVFCHYSDIVGGGYRELHRGDEVEFEYGEGRDGGIKAVRVKVIEPGQETAA